MDPSGWFDQGVLLGIVVAGGVAVWRIWNWLGENFLIPVKDAIVAHIAQLGDATEKMCATMDKQGEILDKVGDAVGETRRDIHSLSIETHQIKSDVEAIRNRVDQFSEEQQK